MLVAGDVVMVVKVFGVPDGDGSEWCWLWW